MVGRLKIVATIFSVVFLGTLMFLSISGKFFYPEKDFVCCKGNQLYMHHYYTLRLIGVEVTRGYKIEAIGKPSADGCNVQCSND